MAATGTVQRMFEAYLAGDAATGSALLAEDFTFTSPTADRVIWQRILELAPVGESGVFIMYEYELKGGGRHRNTEFTVVRDGQLSETHVFFGGAYDGEDGSS
jgi:ketosteroid isomerase-like protein